MRPDCAKYETTFSLSAKTAPSKTKKNSAVDIFLARFSKELF